MRIVFDPAQNETIDLPASAARVRSARALAAAQARRVAAAAAGADEPSIDLLFLLQENVLVMTETHVMLERLAGQEAQHKSAPKQKPLAAPLAISGSRRASGRSPQARRRALSTAVVLGLAIATSAFILEILDPAPMDVEASIAHLFGAHR